MLAEIPMQRFAKAEEIGSVIAFVASPAASYITGANIPVDGGKIKSLQPVTRIPVPATYGPSADEDEVLFIEKIF